MKKYVKPMMESEAFVSNEYVAVCYLVDCSCINNPGEVYKNIDEMNDLIDAFNRNHNGNLYDVSDGYIFIGSINGNNTCAGANTDIHTNNTEYTQRVNAFADWWNRIPILGWFWPIDKIDVITNHHDITISNANSVVGYNHPNAS